MEALWWQKAVVYQIYPRSFQDSDGDGIGDLNGMIQRLPYLEELGIDAIWLSPVYQSPNDDNGYDISDYKAIFESFGTMVDMDNFIQEAKKRGISVIMDLVVNHTSDEHPWFIQARQSKTNKYRDYYIWRDAKNGQEPNSLRSIFSGSAWTFDQQTNQYYMHLFSKKQPDLNWENQQVRQSIYDMMNWWIAKGIGGFRMDVIDLIGKIPDEEITANGPVLHDYLQEMNRCTFGSKNLMTVGETWGATPEIAQLFSDPARKELSMVFQFEHIGLDQVPNQEKWDLRPLAITELKEVLSKWQVSLGNKGWNSLFWNNHDLPRIISRWGDDQDYRVESGKMLAILLHMMKGTPYIYQGEEIGMTNRQVKSIEEVDDIESKNMYAERLAKGYKKEEILRSINAKGRDNARTPMQWSNAKQAGFTSGQPWLAVNPNYKRINVAEALADKQSIFYTYQTLIRLRKENEVVVQGDYTLVTDTAKEVFAYYRSLGDVKWLIICNFSRQEQPFKLNDKVNAIILSNYESAALFLKSGKLRPYEACVLSVIQD